MAPPARSEGWIEDYYFKKRINYSLNKKIFKFDTADLLFSTFEIDLGTQFLLRNLINKALNIVSPSSILDLGCGYGVIGIVLAKFFPLAQVLLADKDLLALRYASHNAALNQTTGVNIKASIGVDDLPSQKFDLIVSNIPGHIGDKGIVRDFILEPIKRLKSEGTYWFVIVSPLQGLIQDTARQHELNLDLVGSRPGHVLYKISLIKELAV